MTRPFARLARLVLLSIALAGCASVPLRRPTPAMQQEMEWSTLMAQVDTAIRGGRYDAADRLLADYATRNPTRAHTTEVAYWRALWKLDPGNAANSPHDAIALLDSYLDSPISTRHRNDATVLRRIAAVLETRATTAAAPTAPTAANSAPRDDKAKDEELAKLKDDLAKANAELERIKKRLAAPTP